MFSYIFSEDLECLLEASDKLRHVSKQFVLVIESVAHFALQVVHKAICLI